MKCIRCASEIPAQSQFCMKCGTPVGTAQFNASAVAFPHAAPSTNRARLIGFTLALIILAAAAFFGFRAFNPTNKAGTVPGGSRIVDAPGVTPTGGPLVDKAGRIGNGGPLTDKSGIVQPGEPKPVDVIDYLAFIKDIERRRITLAKHEVAQVLELSATMTGGNLMANMKENESEITKGENDTYKNAQNKIATWQKEWNDLSRLFLSKAAPQSCVKLRDRYYDMLGKTATSIIQVGNSFSEAMAGNASKALDALTSMKGSASQTIDTAADAADREVADVCDKYHLHKDFDIKADGGGSSLLGGGLGTSGF